MFSDEPLLITVTLSPVKSDVLYQPRKVYPLLTGEESVISDDSIVYEFGFSETFVPPHKS